MSTTSKDRHIGIVKSMTSSTVIVALDDDLITMERTINGKSYRVGQIGSFIIMLVGNVEIVGIINRV